MISLKLQKKFAVIFETLLLNIASCIHQVKMMMENNETTKKLEKDASKLIYDVVRAIDAQKALNRFAWMLFQPRLSQLDAEISMIFIEQIALVVDPNENEVVPLLIENFLECPYGNIFYQRIIKILGNFKKWYHGHVDVAKKVLSFLANALNYEESIADCAAEAMQLICVECKKNSIEFFDGFYEIFLKMGTTCLSNDGEIQIIKAIGEIIYHLHPEMLTIVMHNIFNVLFEKIYSLNGLNASKYLDQMAELVGLLDNDFNKSAAARVFIEYWPILSYMMDACISDDVQENIIEILKCAVKSFGLDLFPILDEMIEKSLIKSNKRTFRMTLKMIIEVFKTMDGRFENCLVTLFEATSTMFFNSLLNESKFNSNIVEKYFELANLAFTQIPLMIVQSPAIIPTIELAINACCVNSKDSNALKFIVNLLTIESFILAAYQREIMSLYAESLIFTLLHNYFFVLPDDSKLNYICDIFMSMKATSNEATREIFEKYFIMTRNCKTNGQKVGDKIVQDFINSIFGYDFSRIF